MSALYIQKEGRQWGPFTTEELEGQVASGAFSREDLFWTEGMDAWHPLSEIVETAPETEGTATTAEEESPPGEEVYFNEEGILVTVDEISWGNGTLEPALVAKSSATIERVKRLRPLLVGIALGVVAVVVALIEVPKTTATHWAIWGGVLLLLLFGLARMLYSGLRTARSMVVLDMVDGSEYIIPAGPSIARKVNDAITRAANDARQRVVGT